MKPEFFRAQDRYQERISKRIGYATHIENNEVTLTDEKGDTFTAPLDSLEYAPVKSDGEYWIKLNSNYPITRTNAFLCHKAGDKDALPVGDHVCIGGADQVRFGDHQGQWQVTIDAPYDEETDSDVRFVGYFASRKEAIEVLWNERKSIATD